MQAKTTGTGKKSITPGRRGQRPQREGGDEGVINPRAVAMGGVDQRRGILPR